MKKIKIDTAKEREESSKRSVIIDPCKVCKNRDFHYLFEGKDRLHYLPGDFRLYQCRSCGLIVLYPPLSVTELSRYYPSNYYSYENSKRVDVPRSKREKLLYYSRHFFRAMNCILYSKLLKQNQDLPAGANTKILDLGCGDGRYLLEKHQKGCVCYGVDIDAGALDRLRHANPAIQTYCGNLWDAHYPDDFFDLINLSHVIEHVAEIDKLLAEVRRIVKKDGLIRIQVPNAASVSFAIFRKYWMPLDVPRHVFVFSYGNLKKLLVDKGFEVVKFRTLENSFSVIGSVFYLSNALLRMKAELMRFESIWNSEILKILLFPYSLIVNLFRLGDTMEFVLKKATKKEMP